MRIAWTLLVIVLAAGCGDDEDRSIVDAALADRAAADAAVADAAADANFARQEALGNLERLYQGALAYRSASGAFLVAASGPTPASFACNGPGNRLAHAPNAAIWGLSPWIDLGFAVTEPHLYSYTYSVVTTGAFTVIAVGDLDCDGVPGSFTLIGQDDGNQVLRHGVIENRPDE